MSALVKMMDASLKKVDGYRKAAAIAKHFPHLEVKGTKVTLKKVKKK